MPASPPELPVDARLPELLAALRRDGAAVLVAPPGTGKTTRVPPALLDELAPTGQVVVLEPRRVAARAAAARIAEERGGRLGDEVGYHVRLDRRAGPDTRLLCATYGLFLRRLIADPFLTGVGAVVLDEFHERSLDADLTLALLQRTRTEAREDLRIVVMSATLDAEPVERFLVPASTITCEGRLHPVEIEHRSAPQGWDATPDVVRAVLDATRRTAGDVLVFLPGRGEIARASAALADRLPHEIVELHGSLSLAEQSRALRQGNRRRVVLATNVAETSVTVQGVTAVVDTGSARKLRFDPGRGLPVLGREPISQAAATQRAGRAGRTGPGLCLRLWPASEHRLRPAEEEPEVRTADLGAAVLQLLAAGESDATSFGWFEAPQPERLATALALLDELGAVRDGRLTKRGGRLAELPLSPRLGTLLLVGRELGVEREAAMAAALLSGRDPFRATDARHHSDSDLADRVDALLGRPSEIGCPRGGAEFVRRVAEQLRDQVSRTDLPRGRRAADPDLALGRAVLAAFPDRVASRRAAGASRARMVGGRGVNLSPRSAVRDADLFVCLAIGGDRGGDSVVHLASGVRREWLELEERDEVLFDTERERVVGLRRTCYRDLVVDERPVPVRDDDAAARALAEAAATDLDRALDLSERETATVLARIEFLRGARPDLELPDGGRAALREALPSLCRGRRSFDELRRLPLARRLLDALSYQARAALDREAPERIQVPSGARVRIDYDVDGPPVLAVRIQEVFGWTETPRIASGRVPLLLHLLAPNGRPQQVTQDLGGFWRGVYHDVRKDLRRRYPRHAWPEDPLTAKAERRPRRRRSN